MIEYHVGVSQGFHDAGIAVVDHSGKIVYAAHSERTSKKKNDKILHPALLRKVGILVGHSHSVNYYERQWLTNLRRLYAGQQMASLHDLKTSLSDNGLNPKMRQWGHHLSHAAAAFQTSPYDRAAVVIVDAVGEWDTISIWSASYDGNGKAIYDKKWAMRYPHSIGLFYTAVTQRIGLRPMEDEYVTMGMAAYGKESAYAEMKSEFIANMRTGKMKKNLHLGMGDFMSHVSDEDMAKTAQTITEELLFNIHMTAKKITGEDKVCYGGGVALNCAFNGKLRNTVWNDAWIIPNPGDCGSSLGAAALGYGMKLDWQHAYLGNIIRGDLDVKSVIDHLETNGMVGVANGAAEFGPRALGNRSLLADPSRPGIKDQVNDIKKRQRYRPFAPAILSEHAGDWFDVRPGFNHDYMQYAVKATKATIYPAICHVDGTCRVQTVPNNGSNMRKILEAWYAKTGIPILLNTSLNIRGEPMVDDVSDAERFTATYGCRVIT